MVKKETFRKVGTGLEKRNVNKKDSENVWCINSVMKPWKIVTEVLKLMEEKSGVGVNLLDLEKIAEDKIMELGGLSANRHYQPQWAAVPFPSVICIGVNDVVCHGIPIDYQLRDGDLVSFDLGVKSEGTCGDAALTIPVGKLQDRDERLLRYAKRTLYKGIAEVKDGVPTRNITNAMRYYAQQNGFVVNFAFSSHGIGTEMHEEPMIPHIESDPISDTLLKEGQMICLEPMLTYKDPIGFVQPDKWTIKTQDGRKSAFFEHQILVTKDDYEVLTEHITK